MTTIRPEHARDVEAIRRVNVEAFGGTTEADLVDRLRDRAKLLLSMVAESGGEVIGHVAFSPVVFESGACCRGVGLGPMAVLPSAQKRGVGSSLVEEGLKRCRQLQYEFAVVLGHPTYYPRFGFTPASRFAIRCNWQVPDEVFMALELRPGGLAAASGLVLYEPEFIAT